MPRGPVFQVRVFNELVLYNYKFRLKIFRILTKLLSSKNHIKMRFRSCFIDRNMIGGNLERRGGGGFRYVFAKRLRTTLEKFLNIRSTRFANTSQKFFNKRNFQKLDKNLKNIICIRTN